MTSGRVANAASVAPSRAPAPWRPSQARSPGWVSSTSMAAKQVATNIARNVISIPTASATGNAAPEPNFITAVAVSVIVSTPIQKPGRMSRRSAAR